MMRGILLVGGTGSRLYPLTLAVNKHLIPVAGKPMVYYPLAVLMQAGIRDVMVVTSAHDRAAFERLFGDGSGLGMSITYVEQKTPAGVPHAISLAESWSNGSPVCVVLGDNIFVGTGWQERCQLAAKRTDGALVFSSAVADPRAYGVVYLDAHGRITQVEEKPSQKRANAFAVPGCYWYGPEVFSALAEVQQTTGCLTNVSDLNHWFWSRNKLQADVLSTDVKWCDAGTHSTLAEANRLVEAAERDHGRLVACLEEIAWKQGWITSVQLVDRLPGMGEGPYVDYIHRLFTSCSQ